MADFATIDDLGVLWRPIEDDEKEKASMLLSAISDLIRFEGAKANIDVDAKTSADAVYANVVRLVTVAVAKRYMLESDSATQMTQMAQSALGYSLSGTYVVGGGGIKLLNNELKQLGFKRQRVGTIEMM